MDRIEKVKRFDAHVDRFTLWVATISFICVVIMMLMNVADVIIAFLFQTHILGAYELTQRLLMCAVFTAFAYGQAKKSHINMTIIIVHFPRPLRFIIFSLMGVLSVIASGAMTYAAAVQTGVAVNAGYMTEVLYIPLWPFYVVETAAMALFTLALLFDTVLSILAIFQEDVAKLVQADWT